MDHDSLEYFIMINSRIHSTVHRPCVPGELAWLKSPANTRGYNRYQDIDHTTPYGRLTLEMCAIACVDYNYTYRQATSLAGYSIPPTSLIPNPSSDSEYVKTNHIFTTFKPLHAPEEYIHNLYSACDVGMNTCCGEGFGLTTAEHACFGKPQIVAGVPALRETLGAFARVIEPATTSTMSRFENHGGEIAHFHPSDFARGVPYPQQLPHFPLPTTMFHNHIESRRSFYNFVKLNDVGMANNF
jgi:hypothetical protein